MVTLDLYLFVGMLLLLQGEFTALRLFPEPDNVHFLLSKLVRGLGMLCLCQLDVVLEPSLLHVSTCNHPVGTKSRGNSDGLALEIF